VTPELLLPESDAAAAMALATRLARRAGQIQVERYERLERVAHKGPRDVVTEVDHLSEELILEGIRGAFPGDAILAEESGAHAAGGGDGPAPGAGVGRAWLVDPLDGTVNYANGLPYFAVSIALVVDGRPAVGVVYDPLRDDLFCAIRGGGAKLGARPIRAADKARLDDCLASVGLHSDRDAERERRLRGATRNTRQMGSSALSLAYVGCGRFDAFVQAIGLSPWDIAAAGLIAEEAGAVVTGLRGEAWFDPAGPTGTAGIVAASARHHPTILALVA